MIATSEYELLTESVGLVDRSERGMFVVRGAEAADFLQGQVSNDVEALAPGTGCYATVPLLVFHCQRKCRGPRHDDPQAPLQDCRVAHRALQSQLR